MAKYIETAESMELPVLTLRGIVAFPEIPISIEVQRKKSVNACEAAQKNGGMIFLAAQKDIFADDPAATDIYRIGTVARIRQSVKTKADGVRIIAEGISRARVIDYRTDSAYISANVVTKTIRIDGDGGIRGEALCMEAREIFKNFCSLLPSVSDEVKTAVTGIRNPGLLADFLASNVLVRFEDKQRVLEKFDPLARLELAAVLMENEQKLLSCEFDIHKRVREQLDHNQRDYYLREQLRQIRMELGEDEEPSEYEEYREKIERLRLPKEVKEKLLKEASKLEKMPFGSAESGVIRGYIDTCLELPWTKKSKDAADVERARKILDTDHDGLQKVKERILEFIAVKELNPDIRNQILCLVGPPGVGKTSVAASVARALKRKYVRVSLGGVRDEADIRGHRKTYIGSMPGRIMEAMTRAGVNNPLILLDEIDKMTCDAHGDPASALLEVLDSEQNGKFRDHFIELPFDLSDCLFIATANTLDTVPSPLIDRMEIIELKTYTRDEKLAIAKHHLLPKQLKRHGMTKKQFHLTDDAITAIIDGYTREAGVRNLEREIASLCRKAAAKLVAGEEKVTITAADLHHYLGALKILPETIPEEDEIGVVNGLAYTEAGGDMLAIEIGVYEGTGKIELTGSLGDVMKESAHIAVSCVRGMAKELKIDPMFYKDKDIHIHAPEGAVPKDGPSAGVTMMTALVSALTGRAVRRTVAMTGELTLRGNVLPIGGLKEKTLAAYRAGVKTVLIPYGNRKDIEELDEAVKEHLTLIPVKNAKEVLSYALCPAIAEETDERQRPEEIRSERPLAPFYREEIPHHEQPVTRA